MNPANDFSPMEALHKDQEEHPERWGRNMSYKGFSADLLRIELIAVESKLARLQEQRHEIQLELGRLAAEHENHD